MAVSVRVASRYAKSLLDIAIEKNAVEEVYKDIKALNDVCVQNRDFVLALNSPIISHDKKLIVLEKVFSSAHVVTKSFYRLITKKNRETALDAIAKQFLSIYNDLKGLQEALIFTPVPLSDLIRKEITDVVGKTLNKKILLQEKVDKDLIGGYILRVNDRQVEASVKAQLQRLKIALKD